MSMTREDIRGIYAITPDTNDFSTVMPAVHELLEAGVDILQFRNKQLNQNDKLEVAKRLQGLCRDHHTVFVINDDVWLAAQLKADALHLGVDDLDLRQARQMLPDTLIGVSCYDQLQLAQKASQFGADYVAFGRFFPSKTKPNAVTAPVTLLAQARSVLDLPIVAIGGITPDNGAELVEQGSDALAVVDSLFSASDIRAQLARFRTVFAD